MAYDEGLAARLREALAGQDGLTEKKMFGGLGFMLEGRMAVAAGSGGGLLLRCDPADTDAHSEQDGVEPFVMRGKPMQGWLYVAPEAIAVDDALARWVDVGTSYAVTLPPKQEVPVVGGRP